MRIVVTGGAGFIGSALVRRLDRDQADGVVVDDFSTGRRTSLAGLRGVTVVEGSILDPDLLEEAFAGAEAVVHLAALSSASESIAAPLRYHEVNATGTLQVLEAARSRGVDHCIIASSAAVYGDAPSLPTAEDHPLRPSSPYGASKVAAEAHAMAAQACFGVSSLVLRPFNVFGPGQRADGQAPPVVPALLDAAVRGRPFTLHGSGNQSRDFIDLATVVEVLVAALRRKVVSSTPVNVASGSGRTLWDVVAGVRDLGFDLDVIKAPARPGDVSHSLGDTGRLRALFPEIEPRPFHVGLVDALSSGRGRG